jgi:hypothetical protein
MVHELGYPESKKKKVTELGLWWGCFLCFLPGCIENVGHLFFGCGFSARLWKALVQKSLFPGPSVEWSDIVSLGIQKWRNKSLITGKFVQIMLDCCCIPLMEAELGSKF